jgi:hypothetical protein
LIEAAVQRGVPLRFVALDEPEVHRLYERRLVLVRPDGHVAWRDDKVPAEPLALIDCVRGATHTAQRGAPQSLAASSA